MEKERLEKYKESKIYKFLFKDFSIIGSLSQTLYMIVATTIISAFLLFNDIGKVFVETTANLELFIFFMVMFLFIHKLDTIVSRNFGIGSIGNYIYLGMWVISLITKTYLVNSIIPKIIALCLVVGIIGKYIIPEIKIKKKHNGRK